MKTFRNYLILALFIGLASFANAQISLHPTIVFMDPASRSAEMTVKNVSDVEREIEVNFKFGYQSYDSLGNGFINYNDTIIEKEYSLAPVVKIYPKRLVIPAGEQQTIRFIMTGNTSAMPDKVYWCRMVVSSSPIAQQIDTTIKDISAAIVIKTEMVGILIYQKGNVDSDLDLAYNTVYADTTRTYLVLEHIKKGNSPFWGSMVITLFDENDEKVTELNDLIAIYFSAPKRLPIDKKLLQSGKKYTAKIFINNEREDLPSEYRLKYKSMKKEFTFIAP